MVSLGKFRHLTQCATPEGHFVVLAIDHRANLRDALGAARGALVEDNEFAEFKRDVVLALGDLCSGVLGDPAFVLGAGISSGLLRGSQGLIAPIEVTNYALHPSEREVQFIPGWNVEKAKRAGLSGMKLLVYYNPDADNAGDKRRLVGLVSTVCARYDMPLYVEPVLHPQHAGTGLDSRSRMRYSVETAHHMVDLGVDVLKLEFPVDTALETDEYVWDDALGRLNEACGNVPWVLLSGGVEVSVFARQVDAACQAGCSGVIAGRALWNPAIKASAGGSDSRISVLRARARQELQSLADTVRKRAAPFWKKTGRPNPPVNWYESYSGFNGSK